MTRAAALVVIAACGAPARPAAIAAPPPPPPSCRDLGPAFDRMTPHPDPQGALRVGGVEACTDDAWTADQIRCFIDGRRDADWDRCHARLSPAQRQSLDAHVEAKEEELARQPMP